MAQGHRQKRQDRGNSAAAGDANRWLGIHSLVELENMVAAGFSPIETIAAATRDSAKALRRDQLGMIAPGKSADFVVLDANPLDAIANVRKINAVWLRGQAVIAQACAPSGRRSGGRRG